MASAAIKKEDIEHYEVRHVVYCPPLEPEGDDYHMVKEQLHMKDGTIVPNVRWIKNYKRPFWITQKGFQNHEQKKEREHISKLKKYETTQSKLQTSITRALGQPWFKGDLRRLFRNQFIYGADILSTAVLKRHYMDNFKGQQTRYTVATFDTEKDVIKGTDEINMATISFGSRVYTAVKKDFFQGRINVMEKLHEAMQKYLGAFVEDRKIEWEVELVDTDVEIIKNCFAKAHAWKPDFLAIWNKNFDIPLIVNSLEKKGINPADVFSDPNCPAPYKFFKYKQGPKQKKTASGKVMPIKPAAQWHTTFTPASFYVIDAMCAYRHIRTGSQEEPSYALDAILDKEFKDIEKERAEKGLPPIRKLKFEEANHLSGIDWHQFMQEKYPIEYVIYNVFDCISMELLDEQTVDLQLSLPMMSGCSDFDNFKSQPRRRADDLHYFAMEDDHIFGTTSDEMATEEDKYTLGLDGWIVTLPAHLVDDNGLQCIEENPNLRTNIRAHVADLDVSAS